MSPILQHPPPRPPPAAEEEDLSEEEGLDKAVLMTGGGPKVKYTDLCCAWDFFSVARPLKTQFHIFVLGDLSQVKGSVDVWLFSFVCMDICMRM